MNNDYNETGMDNIDQSSESEILEKGLLYADYYVNKEYLSDLTGFEPLPVDDSNATTRSVRLFQITRIVYDTNESINDKLISVYSALFNLGTDVLFLIRSTRDSAEFYIGIHSDDNASAAEVVLRKSLQGTFPGSNILPVDPPMIEELFCFQRSEQRFQNNANIASVSVIPSLRDEDKEKFVQGMEKFIDTMKGTEYTAVFLAEPLPIDVLEQRKTGLAGLYSCISPYASTQLTYGVNSSKAVSQGMSKSFSKTLNQSLTDTNTHTDSKTRNRNKGHSFRFLGLGLNRGRGTAYTHGDSWSKAVTEGSSDTTGTSVNDSVSDTTGESRSITITNENKSVKYILETIDEHLKRIRLCESYGMWDAACYFISEDIQTSVIAASTYKALMSGNSSGVENSYVNIWNGDFDQYTPLVLESLRYCQHPKFKVPEDSLFNDQAQVVTACSMISGNELPLLLGLPRRSVPGVTVLNMAQFGRNVSFSSGSQKGRLIEFGNVSHMGEKDPTRVRLDLESFRSHCFITGSTGCGKSNTTYRILDEMIRYNIPFLVVEPAKGEYKRYYGSMPGINIFCTNPRYFSMLRINPFKFDPNIHVLEHLDRLIEIFNACWPLYAAMPAILKESFERAYIMCGWDLRNSVYIPNGRSKYPTFREVLEALPEIINSSAYSSDSKGDYTGALITRVKSLTNGISGQVLCSSDDIDDEELFDTNAIVDLSRVASLEIKSLLMGLLILKLNEYRMCTSEENQPLRHITVMEEAHNILKRSSSGSTDGSNVQAKSVEMISSAIAEMRTYGEGFIIVDQSPSAVDVSAVKNTNTKIVMRLPDSEDAKTLGLSMGLNEEQIREIARFPTGVAAVYQNNWVEAVLTKIDKSEEIYHQTDVINNEYEMSLTKGALVIELIVEFESGIAYDEGFRMDELMSIVEDSGLNIYKKQELRRKIVDICSFFEKEPLNNGTFADMLADLLSCDGMFEALPLVFTGDYSEKHITRGIIDSKDIENIKQWYKHCYEHLDGYALITDDNIKSHALRYLLLNRKIKESDNNRYPLIYEGMFGKGGKK